MQSRERRDAPAAGEIAKRSRLAAQWGILIGRLTDRLTHEIRNPLNGAMVNLQVVRSRAARSGHDAAALEPFAASAAAELERASGLIESLLVVLRPVPHDSEADVAGMLGALVPLYRSVAMRAGGSLMSDQSDVADVVAAGNPEMVRVALAGALEAATRNGGTVSVRLERAESSVIARLHRAGGIDAIAPELSELLEDAGITGERSADDFALHFPAAARAKTNRRS